MTEVTPPSPAVYRGRFAPSPTGALHFGSLLAAVGSWLRARSLDGEWLVRVEDIDPPREVPGASADILATLDAFALVSDRPVWFQRDRPPAYEAALQRLIAAGLVFPCLCSRSDLGTSPHRGRCPAAGGSKREPAWRFLVPDQTIAFHDGIRGEYRQSLPEDVGDFVLRRSDGLWAYQLAVVVDDAEQAITEIVRGADLLDSTPRQIALQHALGLPTPAYAHLPVLLDEDGRKLSKQAGSLPVDAGDPLPALRHALSLLGIPGDRQPRAGTPELLLSAAVPLFRLDQVPAVASLRSATWQSEANR